jgi:hypothetical protein
MLGDVGGQNAVDCDSPETIELLVLQAVQDIEFLVGQQFEEIGRVVVLKGAGIIVAHGQF